MFQCRSFQLLFASPSVNFVSRTNLQRIPLRAEDLEHPQFIRKKQHEVYFPVAAIQ